MTVSDQDSPRSSRASVSDADEFLHHHTEFPTTLLSQWLDGVLTWIGKLASWLWIVVTAVIIWAVVSRYLFGEGSVLLEEVQWHLAGIGWLLGLAYTLVVDDHVRVDVIHERLSLKAQGWIELLGLVFLLLPFLIICVKEMVPYAMNSWSVDETSQAPGGLPDRWALKFVIAGAFSLLAVAAFSRLLKVTAFLFGFPRPIAVTPANKNQKEQS